MGRLARARSWTGVYHVMMKGIDDRIIFLDDFDRQKFIDHIRLAKQDGGFELYAYCLMDNHVHLLLKEEESLGESIKRIAVRYSHYHNKKYGRVGHLFNNRYRSETIHEERYLQNVFCYIHQNPVRAGIVSAPDTYKWSSYTEYTAYYRGYKTWLNTKMMLPYFPNEKSFADGVEKYGGDDLDHMDMVNGLKDSELLDRIQGMCKLEGIRKLGKVERDQLLREIRMMTKASCRQIGRVTGVSCKIVERAMTPIPVGDKLSVRVPF